MGWNARGLGIFKIEGVPDERFMRSHPCAVDF
jgi:hypothetical protein